MLVTRVFVVEIFFEGIFDDLELRLEVLEELLDLEFAVVPVPAERLELLREIGVKFCARIGV